MSDLQKRNESRAVVTTLNAEAVVRLTETQNAKIAAQSQVIESLTSRLSVLEQEFAAMRHAEFVRKAAAMGSGSTV